MRHKLSHARLLLIRAVFLQRRLWFVSAVFEMLVLNKVSVSIQAGNSSIVAAGFAALKVFGDKVSHECDDC